MNRQLNQSCVSRGRKRIKDSLVHEASRIHTRSWFWTALQRVWCNRPTWCKHQWLISVTFRSHKDNFTVAPTPLLWKKKIQKGKGSTQIDYIHSENKIQVDGWSVVTGRLDYQVELNPILSQIWRRRNRGIIKILMMRWWSRRSSVRITLVGIKAMRKTEESPNTETNPLKRKTDNKIQQLLAAYWILQTCQKLPNLCWKLCHWHH